MEDDEAVSKKYDQFKDKKSSYDFNNYTSQLDQSKITKEQRQEASRIEKELENDKESKRIQGLEVKEEGEGEGNEEMQFSAVARQQEGEQGKQNHQPLMDFKKTLMHKLGGSDSKNKTIIDDQD